MKSLLESAIQTTEFRLSFLHSLRAMASFGPVSDSDAINSIRRYQLEKPDSAKSVWMDDSIVRAINGGQPVAGITGVRIYFARYTFGPAIDQYTVIVALTESNTPGLHTDKSGNYYDYGQPCPPNTGCNGGLVF